MRNYIRKVLQEQVKEISEARRYTNYDINDESFAKLFQFFLTELPNNTGFSRAKMRRAFALTIRKWTEKPPQIISKKVIDHFISNYPNLNPFKVGYRPRGKFGIDVIFEHTTPINIFVTQLFNSKSLEEIRELMKNYTGMCIVTSEEDECLNTKGFSRTRPQGWQQAYTACDIQVMTEDEYKVYKTQIESEFNTDQEEEILN